VLQSPQPPPTESILTTLLNDITTISDSFTLVLDDYHLIDAKLVDNALAFLIEHLPPKMHLVINTREDPQLPLYRLRARGQLTELRAADLRFTPEEASAFLNKMINLNLSVEDIAALETRTEGWIAGLQLAALSIQGRSDTAGFIQAFTGSHRFVLDYLVEEVLQHQSEYIRSFLLQTAILDRFCAPLCNAVTEREDGKEMLDVLERSNLFLIPLDDMRQWYRYHHLFADVLQAHLIEAQPEQVSSLRQRASAWYEQNGFPPDAIHHALVATLKSITSVICRIDEAELIKVPKQGPLIIYTNHVNILEIPILYTHLRPRHVHGMLLAERWNIPVLNWVLDVTETIPLHRGEADIDSIRKGLQALEKGEMLVIAPEGSRCHDGQLQAAHPGVVLLALHSRAPILPVIYFGAENYNENLSRLRRTDFHLRVGKQFHLDDRGEKVTRLVREKILEEMMYEMATILPPEYRGYYADVSTPSTRYIKFD